MSPPYIQTFETTEKKLGLGKAFGKQMEKMGVPIKKSSKTAATNPLGQPQTTYQPTNLLSPRGAGPTQNTGNLPALVSIFIYLSIFFYLRKINWNLDFSHQGNHNLYSMSNQFVVFKHILKM